MWRSSEPSISRSTLVGMVGTAALATMICKPFEFFEVRLGRARLGAQLFSDPHRLGWMLFFVFEGVVILPMGFAFLSRSLPGNRMVKGLIFGTLV